MGAHCSTSFRVLFMALESEVYSYFIFSLQFLSIAVLKVGCIFPFQGSWKMQVYKKILLLPYIYILYNPALICSLFKQHFLDKLKKQQ